MRGVRRAVYEGIGSGRTLAAAVALFSLGCGAVSRHAMPDAAAGSGGGGSGAGGLAVGTGAGGAPGGAGGGGASTAPDAGDAARTCSPEICNGIDDDCDGVIDNGCPLDGQALSTRTISATSPVYGSVSEVANTKFTDVCPDGQAVIGFVGNSGAALDAVGVNCGTLVVHEDRSTIPYRYSIDVQPGMDFAPQGGTGGGKNTIDAALLCGLQEVVTSVRTWNEPGGEACPTNGCTMATGSANGCPLTFSMADSCTRYTITGQPGSFALSVASGPVDGARVGGNGRPTAPAVLSTFTCDGGGLLQGVHGAFGRYPPTCSLTVVVGMQLTCADPVIPLR